MAGIVIFGGTTEGRKLAEALAGMDVPVWASVATEYGAQLLPKAENVHVQTGRMDEDEMATFLEKASASLVLDATHPYAAIVSENISRAAKACNVELVRIRRGSVNTSKMSADDSCRMAQFDERKKTIASAMADDVIFVDSVEEAARFLNGTEGNILVTTGSKELEKYTCIEDYQERCMVRVLPSVSVLEKCAALGFEGKNITAMQGPFDVWMNLAQLKSRNCAYLVTKESGKEGGYEEKCLAALECGAKIVVVRRPTENIKIRDEESMTLEEAFAFLAARFPIKQQKRILSLVGLGPGDPSLLTKRALQFLEEADCLIGAGRMLEICKGITALSGKETYSSYRKEEIAAFLKANPHLTNVALVFSGDIGFYSGAQAMREAFPAFEVRIADGISSATYFLNKIGVNRKNLRMLSCHGERRNLVGELLHEVHFFSLMGRGTEINAFCEQLLAFGMTDVELVCGERLSYPNERIVAGSPGELAGEVFDDLCVLYAKREENTGKGISLSAKFTTGESGRPDVERTILPVLSNTGITLPGLPDDAFLRDASQTGGTPMTKQAVRILSLSKLALSREAIVYDIGAGTGSVSVEASLLAYEGTVFAIEKKEAALELLAANRQKFGCANMEIISGEAPEILEELPAPTHVFIGGSGGRLLAIVDAVRKKNPKARFVVTAVTLETIDEIDQLASSYPEYATMERMQVNVSVAKEVGAYHLLTAQNPVMIASFGGEQDG